MPIVSISFVDSRNQNTWKIDENLAEIIESKTNKSMNEIQSAITALMRGANNG